MSTPTLMQTYGETWVPPPKLQPLTPKPKTDPSKKMIAVEWHGNKDMRIVERPQPTITDPADVVVRITATTICGSDLHFYHKEMAGMKGGDITGHEFMGIVDQVGPEVKTLKIGDRVVVAFGIACGQCWYCKNNLTTLCDCSNPKDLMVPMYGHKLTGAFGYSHLTGGFDGGQAEYCRVPYADTTCLKVPDNLKDEQVLFLSDIICTGWHANECAGVSKGQTVVVWGCGPVGLMATAWAKFRGASRVVAIDNVPYRLEVARKLGAETIDFSKEDVVKTCLEKFPGGADCCLECCGFRFPKGVVHTVEKTLMLETDVAQTIAEAFQVVRKGGFVSLIGDFFGYANHFPVGALMEKMIHVCGGQAHVQRYWKQLLEYIETGQFDPTFIITHTMPLDKAVEAYKMFDKKEDNVLKIVLKPTPRTV